MSDQDQNIKTEDQNTFRDQDRRRNRGLGRIGAGLFLLLIGGVLLLDQMGFPLPDWLFNWHVPMLVAGLFIGLRHNFRGGAWLVLILIGGFFFLQDYYPRFPLQRFIWPAVLIFVGMMIIISPKGHRSHWRDSGDWSRHAGRWRRKKTQGFPPIKKSYSPQNFFPPPPLFRPRPKK